MAEDLWKEIMSQQRLFWQNPIYQIGSMWLNHVSTILMHVKSVITIIVLWCVRKIIKANMNRWFCIKRNQNDSYLNAHKKSSMTRAYFYHGIAYGIWTRGTALRGLWLNRLPNATCFYCCHIIALSHKLGKEILENSI